jgi:CobQ-like glutamine amidotransferase family enzyme
MNLYGENGNIVVLAAALRSAGFEVKVTRSSLDSEIDLTDSDLVYIGCGTENRQLQALAHLEKNRSVINDYLDEGGLLLATGNAADLFGQQIVQIDGSAVRGLSLFDFTTWHQAERQVGEVLFQFEQNYLIGFQNSSGRIECHDSRAIPLFEVNRGFGTVFTGGAGTRVTAKDRSMDTVKDQNREGFRINGFVATSVLGLVTRNPYFIVWLAEKVINNIEMAVGQPAVIDSENQRNGNSEAVHSQQFYAVENTISAYERFNLRQDIVAFEAFLANHHSILNP